MGKTRRGALCNRAERGGVGERQPDMVCIQEGLGSYAEQPEPVSSEPLLVFHTDSTRPREFDADLSQVPPTGTTFGEVAG